MKNQLSYLAYLLGWKVIGILPESLAYSLFRRIAAFMYSRNGRSVQRYRTNISIVRPDLSKTQVEEVLIRGVQSYMRYWCDTFRIHKWSSTRISDSVQCTHDELLRNPMVAGRGVVIALPHSGNWDHAGAYFCQEGFPLVTIAEVLKPEKLFEKFLAHRNRMGFEVLPLNSRAFPTVMRRAKEKRLIALVSDRDLSSSGIEVSFFSRRTRMPAGPALLALKTGIPLVSAHVSYTAQGIHIDFKEIAVASEGTEDERLALTVQAMATSFESGIYQHPEDWHMLQRIWIEEGLYS
jgi:KDO2-lipid IV(A) lauroyltransferase